MGFLSNVAHYSETNKMGATNLALVFGPNMLWIPEDKTGISAFNIKGVSITLQIMISHFEDVFKIEHHETRSSFEEGPDSSGDEEEGDSASQHSKLTEDTANEES